MNEGLDDLALLLLSGSDSRGPFVVLMSELSLDHSSLFFS